MMNATKTNCFREIWCKEIYICISWYLDTPTINKVLKYFYHFISYHILSTTCITEEKSINVLYLWIISRQIVKLPSQEVVAFIIEMKCHTLVVFWRGIWAQDICIQLHLPVCACQLKCLIRALGEHQELNGWTVVIQLLEESEETISPLE